MSKAATSIDVIKQTPFGKIRGQLQEGVLSFRRLPYAEAPVGNRRFALPERIASWEGVKDCREEGPVPPQLPSRLDKAMGTYAAMQDEDCLHVDVWLPEHVLPGAPLFVFLHGGGFMTGGGSLSCYEGAQLAARTGMIVINVSYRFGVLGFLPISGMAPANLGLHDQVSALHFIRDIASSLGGDPDNITVAGQSAGAYSIAVLLGNPDTRPLFKRAVMMSTPFGTTLLTEAQAAQDRGQFFTTTLGVSNQAELNALPVSTLLKAQVDLLRHCMGRPGDITPPFMPVIDGVLIHAEPKHVLTVENVSQVDVLIGSTRDEMMAFFFDDEKLRAAAPEVLAASFVRRYGAEEAVREQRKHAASRVPASPLELLSDVESDACFTDLSLAVARTQASHGGNVFVYRFDWQAPGSKTAACHCIELPFLFGNIEHWQEAAMLAGADLQEMRDLSRVFQDALAAFAYAGQPSGLDLPDWPRFDQRGAALHFNRKIEAFASHHQSIV